MTFKMQADMALLQAHYDELVSRVEELEKKQELMLVGINNILGENNTNPVGGIKVPRNKNKGKG